MRAGDGSWVGQSMISVTLSSMIFEEKDTCLTSVTEVPSPPADASHPSLPFALLLSHQWDSSTTVPLK